MNRLQAWVVALSKRLGPWRFAALVGFLVLVPLSVRLALDSGISWDEEFQLEYGKRIFAWFHSGFKDHAAFEYRDLYLYGGLFDFPTVLLLKTHLLPWGEYEARHVMTALLAVLGVLAVWLTANRIAGPRAGTMAAVALLLTPTWVGHGFFNCKDIPFGVAATFVLYMTTTIAMTPKPVSWRHALLSGVAVGCALGVRSGGMFLFALPSLAATSRLVIDGVLRWKSRQPVRFWANLRQLFVRMGCAFSIAWALMISAWPWAQVSPIKRPLQASSIAKHFTWGDVVRFNGRDIAADQLPRSYLPTWFRITLPELYLIALACAVVVLLSIWRHRVYVSRALATALVVFSLALPLTAVLVLRPVMYDAHRHFLFFFPILAVLAGLAFNAFLFGGTVSKGWRIVVWSLLALTGVDTLSTMRALHPYEYIYFNRVSGGLPAKADAFETDYWGLTYREAFKWVLAHVPASDTDKVSVGVCNMGFQLDYFVKEWKIKNFTVEGELNNAKIRIAFKRFGCKDTPGETIHIIEREGVPLTYVRRGN